MIDNITLLIIFVTSYNILETFFGFFSDFSLFMGFLTAQQVTRAFTDLVIHPNHLFLPIRSHHRYEQDRGLELIKTSLNTTKFFRTKYFLKTQQYLLHRLNK